MEAGLQEDLRAIASLLDAGLYINNLHEMLSSLGSAVQRASGAELVAIWVLESVIADLREHWDDRRLPSDEYSRVCDGLLPVLGDVVEGLLQGRAAPELVSSSARLIERFLTLERPPGGPA